MFVVVLVKMKTVPGRLFLSRTPLVGATLKWATGRKQGGVVGTGVAVPVGAAVAVDVAVGAGVGVGVAVEIGDSMVGSVTIWAAATEVSVRFCPPRKPA